MLIKDRQEFSSKPKPLTASKDTSVFDAVEKMKSKNFGSIIIVDEDQRLLGMFTERDLLKRVVGEGKSPLDVKLEDVMTTELRVAREDDSVLEWLRIMSNERFRVGLCQSGWGIARVIPIVSPTSMIHAGAAAQIFSLPVSICA